MKVIRIFRVGDDEGARYLVKDDMVETYIELLRHPDAVLSFPSRNCTDHLPVRHIAAMRVSDR